MTLDPTLASIARPSGTFAMVAMDQRESLRTMFEEVRGFEEVKGFDEVRGFEEVLGPAEVPGFEQVTGSDEVTGAGRRPIADQALVDFKRVVAETLGPSASGFLIDRHYGWESVRDSGVLRGGLILAADALEQPPGGPVEETGLDHVVTDELALDGVAAIKLLIIWRRDDRRAERVRLAQEFIAAARRRGVLSVLEPVVRSTPAETAAGTWDGDAAIREAAEELSPLGASLYKVQVPSQGAGPADALESACRRLGESITGPWVVLSQGVHRDDFHAAVTAACRGGASGFLAGRALWSDVVGAADVRATLEQVSVPRLQALAAVVDEYARPWTDHPDAR